MRLRRSRLRPPGGAPGFRAPKVALFLLFVGAPRPFDPLREHQAPMKRAKEIPWPLRVAWCRRRGSNPHGLAATGF